MRALILACAFCLIRAGCAYGLEGDPFADGQQDFSSLQKIETPDSLVLGGFVESRNQLALHHFNRPVSLWQKLQFEALWRRDALSPFLVISRAAMRERPSPGRASMPSRRLIPESCI